MTTLHSASRLDRLREFVDSFSAMLDRVAGEDEILAEGSGLLRELVSHDDWLPPRFAMPNPQRYQQYLLHCDSRARFCIVSFVWAPGQFTPIHNHTIWGLVGMLRGSEIAQTYRLVDGRPFANGSARTLIPGDVELLSPGGDDIHKVTNAAPDNTAISIHVYGGDIGSVERAIFHEDGRMQTFISGYANDVLPNFWGCPE